MTAPQSLVTTRDKPVTVGIDLGGTGVRIVVTHGGPEPIAQKTLSTRWFADDPIRKLDDEIRELTAQHTSLTGIGIGASGPVHLQSGTIVNPDTLPEFTRIDIAGLLSQSFSVPVWLDNDAVAASQAELEWGNGQGETSLMCVTLGTGVGVAVATTAGPVRALDGEHPEAGHIPVSGIGNTCYCGLDNCWEQTASRERLHELLEAQGPEGFDSYARSVAEGLVALITIYRPSIISFSGSVTRYWNELEPAIRSHLAASREYTPELQLNVTALGDLAGALGATLLARDGIGFQAGPS
jgi:glucokinase